MAFSRCTAHTSHNSGHWATRRLATDEVQFSKDAFVAIEGVRNSFSQLMDHLPDFVIDRVTAYSDLADEPTYYEMYELGVALGMQGYFLELMAEMKLRYLEGHLLVTADAMADPMVYRRVESILLHAWRIEKFTDSRWLMHMLLRCGY